MEYVTDVPYVRHFIGELGPASLRLVAALNGVAPPPADDVDFCELGSAHGDTLAALAAAHPRGRFLGVDINGEHVATARRLAREGGLENIGFLERDFAALEEEDVGELDFVVAHGVLSWIAPDKRRALMRLAQAKLKPGGLLYVSYNAMPGWASVEPLRQLLLNPVDDRDGTPPGAPQSSLERARRGLAFARALREGRAEYFTKNPAAAEMLQTMEGAGLAYVAHEYLHEHWAPMYFARVAWEMAECDLHFVGVQPLFLNFPELAIPEPLDPLFTPVSDRATFESLKDFATNEFFRRDVYVKGRAPRTPSATDAFVDETPWGALSPVPPPPAARRVRLPHRALSLEGPIFDALFAALAEGAATGASLAARPELAAFGVEKLRAAIVRLVLASHVVPMLRPTRACAAPDARLAVPLPYNQTMLRRLSSDAPIVLASTVAGTAFALSALEALAIRVLTEAAPREREAWVRALVDRSVLRIAVGGRVVEERDEQREVILGAVRQLRATRLAKLVELGVLEPAS